MQNYLVVVNLSFFRTVNDGLCIPKWNKHGVLSIVFSLALEFV